MDNELNLAGVSRTRLKELGIDIRDYITREDVMDFLGGYITEENTDQVLDVLTQAGENKLPWYIPTAFVRKVLDSYLPEGLLAGINTILSKVLR